MYSLVHQHIQNYWIVLGQNKNLLFELFIPFSFSFFVGYGRRSYENVYLHFFKSLACLALQSETIVKKITQPKSPKTKNELTKICNEPGKNGKRYPFANVKMFCHWIWKTFWHLDGANSIETVLWTGKSVSYMSVNRFWLNLPYPKFSR